MKSIVLMGIKHCGKSTQARMISEKLGCDSFDTDDVIAEMTGKTPREIYTESGEGEFKKAEVMACRKVCGDLSVSGKRAVIAAGGEGQHKQGGQQNGNKLFHDTVLLYGYCFLGMRGYRHGQYAPYLQNVTAKAQGFHRPLPCVPAKAGAFPPGAGKNRR